MSRRDIRLITTIQGFTIIKQECENTKDNNFSNIITDAKINKKVADLVYLGWDKVGIERGQFIKDLMFELEDQDITYKIAIMEEIFEAIDIYEYVSPKDENKNIPTPYIERVFNEKEIAEELESYSKEMESETIEYN